MIKVGFIGDLDSISKYPEALEGSFDLSEIFVDVYIPGSEQHPGPLQMAKRIFKWADERFEAVVVLDEGIEDKREMFSGIRYYVERGKIEHDARIIFVASPERLSSDEDVCALAYDGVFDLVLPFRGDDPVAKVVELIKEPATASNVRYVAGSSAKSFDPSEYEALHPYMVEGGESSIGEVHGSDKGAAPSCAPEGEVPGADDPRDEGTPAQRAMSYRQATPREEPPEKAVEAPRAQEAPAAPREHGEEAPAEALWQRSFLRSNNRVIGVTSLGYRGGSTTLALHIATTIYQAVAKYSPEKPKTPSVAVVTSQKTFDALSGMYRSAAKVMDGGRFVRFDAFDMYVGHHVGVPNVGYTYTILDFGWIPQKKDMRTAVHEEMDDILSNKCNLPVMAIPMGTAEDVMAFVDYTKDHKESELKRKAYVLWGATGEVARQAKGRMLKHCPTTFIEDMAWIAMPEWVSGEVDPKMMDLLEGVLDSECVREYRRAVRKKERAAAEEAEPEAAVEGSPAPEGEGRRSLFGGLFGKGR